MTVDVEARIRQANLVSKDDQLEQLFDRGVAARLLRTVTARKEGRIMDNNGPSQPIPLQSKASGIDSAEKLGSKTPPTTNRRPILAWGLSALAIVAVVGVTWWVAVDDEPQPVASPIDTANAFMAALDAHDVDAMLELTSEEMLAANSDKLTIENFRSQIEQREVLGWSYDFRCETTSELPKSTIVTCPYAFTNHITDVFGLGSYPDSVVSLRVQDGEIVTLGIHEFTDVWQLEGEGLSVFHDWMVDNYPDEERAESFYYNYTDEANLDFWKEYMPLLLASEEASG